MLLSSPAGAVGADSGSLTGVRDGCLSCAATPCVAVFLSAMLCVVPHCISNRGFWLGRILLGFVQVWIKQAPSPCMPPLLGCRSHHGLVPPSGAGRVWGLIPSPELSHVELCCILCFLNSVQALSLGIRSALFLLLNGFCMLVIPASAAWKKELR